MSVADDRLELLIGRLFDGELSAAQRRDLEAEVERSPEARALLEHMRWVHECCDEAIARDVVGPDTAAAEVFQRAWEDRGGPIRRRFTGRTGGLRFGAGLAAGFLLGLAVHFAIVRESIPSPDPRAQRPPTSESLTASNDLFDGVKLRGPEDAEHVIRRVDWYGFTDRGGNQWLIEGIREDVARPAVHYTDL